MTAQNVTLKHPDASHTVNVMASQVEQLEKLGWQVIDSESKQSDQPNTQSERGQQNG